MMKTNRLLLLCILCLCTFSLFATSPKREFRATWLAAVGVDWPNSKVSTPGNATQIAAQKAELVGYLDDLVAGNMNAICYHVRPMADAFYKSNIDLVPWSHYLMGWGMRGQDPGYDPLEYAIQEAHARGLELHAWLNPFRYRAETLPESFYTKDKIKNNHPDWILTYTTTTTDGNGNTTTKTSTILDPGNPDVRAHIVAVVQDIVEHYDIDGIIFDDYFYPYDGTQNEDAISQENKPAGMTLADWRRDNVNKTIEAVYDMIAASSKPWVRFGISPFGIYSTSNAAHTKYDVPYPANITGMDAYNQIYCDPLAWMQGGYIDYISPQLYWPISPAKQSYSTLTKWWSDRTKEFSDNQIEGKTIHFFSSQSSANHGTGEIGSQIDYNRQYDLLDAPGTIFFSHKNYVSKDFETYLKTNKFTQLSLPPAMDWKATETLVAPTNVTLSGSTLSWSHSSAERFTVYAYTKGIDNAAAMADPSNLVRVVYGKSLDVSSVSGYANKTFAVCAYDRYGNEFAAGYYNVAALEPSITASVDEIVLEGEKDVTPAPYVDVVIKGKDLSAAISCNSMSGSVTLETLEGWNNMTGGTLRVWLNPAFVLGVGTYTSYVAVQSGEKDTPAYARIEIPLSVTITNPVPALTASQTTISLTGVFEDIPAPYVDVVIKGKALSNDISISNSNADIVTHECLSGWNARTGGTLRLTLNTNQSVGNYSNTITLESGDITVSIVITATIEEPSQIDPTPFVVDKPLAGDAPTLTKVWAKSLTNLGLSAAQSRSMAIHNGILYLSNNTSGYYTVNQETGVLTAHTVSGIGNFHGHNLRITADGQMLVGNSGAGQSTITAYTINSGTATALKPTATITKRTDYFNVYGNWNESGYILALEQGTGRLIKIPFSNGALEEVTYISNTTLENNNAVGKVYPIDNSSFYASRFSKTITKHSLIDGSVIEGFGTVKPVSNVNVSGLGVFSIYGHTYMITPTDRNGAYEILEITDGISKAVRLNLTAASLGTGANGVGVEFCTYTDGNDVYIYTLAPYDGMSAYKFTFTPKYDAVFTNASGDGNWGMASNWQDGKMPTLTDHVLVKAPCTVNVNNAVAKSINLLKGSGTLTIAAQAALTVDGTVRRVDNETFPATRSYTSVSDILIEANANSTGIFAHKDAEGKTRAMVQIYGHYTTENGYDNVKWQYVAMPSHQEHAITKFTGGWLLRFDEPNDDWAYLNDADPVELFQGYLLLQPSVRMYHFPSKLAPVAPQTITLSRKGTTGENLLGNSWTAPLHINQFTESDFVNIDATIHLWNYQEGDDGSYGQYYEHPIKTSETVINPLQAFFIVTKVDGATITLDPANLINSTGAHGTLNPYKAPQRYRQQAAYEEMRIRVTGNDKYYCDIRLLQNEEYTAGFDNGYDGRKLEGDAPIPYLAGVSTDGDMAVLATPQYDGTYLNFRKGSNGEQYTFTFAYDGTTEYFLEDIRLGVRQAIRANESYTFTPSDDDSYRFRIVAAQKAPDQTTNVPTVWASDSKLYLTNPLGVETTVAVYSASGQLIHAQTTTEALLPLESLTTGVYIIYVRSVFGTQMIKHIM